METLDSQVLEAALSWAASGEPIALITVLKTWGSSPRPPGAWLVLNTKGQLQGSVSGGCIEDDLILKARSGELMQGQARTIRYGVSAEEARQFGLPCGGTLELLLEPSPAPQQLETLNTLLSQGQLVTRHVNVATGESLVQATEAHEPLQWDGTKVSVTHGPSRRLLVIGAGQIAQFLAPIALASGYKVYICEPREEYASLWRVAGTTVMTDMPDDAVQALVPDANTAIVALTHDPKLDDLALMEALRSKAFYVGALGSEKNQSKRRERLKTHFEFTDEELAHLHGPVGLRIGSRTPPEIAVAIMAEMIAKRSQA